MPDKPTYKKIPERRFPEFKNDGDWEVKRLGEIITVNSGRDYKHLNQGGIPVYGTGGYMLSVDDKLSDIDAIGIGRKGTIDKPQYLKAPFWTVDTLFFLTTKEGYDLNFVFCLLQTVEWKKYSEQTGVPSLTRNTIDKIEVKIPPLAEQRRIAACLSALDEMLAATNGKLEQLKAYKKGLMQKLFPAKGKKLPYLRFKEFEKDGGWEEVPFGSIIKECKDVSKVENEDVLLSSAIEGIFLNSEIFTHQRGSSNIGYRKLRKNMLILSAQNLHLGNANVNLRFEHGLISPAYKIYEINNCFPEFLYHWIKKDSTKEFFFDATIEGASVCRRNVMWNKLYEQKISNPSFLEQRKIASCLSTMDDQINAYTEKVGLLGQYKKGLMQRMFPIKNNN